MNDLTVRTSLRTLRLQIKSASAQLPQLRSHSLMRNSAFIIGTTIVTSGLGYLYWMVAAHGYSAYEVGLASSLISLMTLVSSLSNLGVGATLVRLLPRRTSGVEWSVTVTTALAIVGVMGIISAALLVLLVPLAIPQLATILRHLSLPLTIAFAVGIVCMSLSTILDQTFVAERASVNMFVRNTAFSVLKLTLIVAPLLLMPGNVLLILLSWVGAAALSIIFSLLILIPRLRREYRPTLTGAADQLRSMRRLLAGNHFVNVGALAPMYLLPVFVTLRLSVVQSAYFYTTWMVAAVVFMISPSIASALYAEGSHHPERIGAQVRSSIRMSAALVLPAIVVLCIVGYPILSLFGHAYAVNGYWLLVILALAGIPDGITNLYVSLLRVEGRVFHAGALNLGMAVIALVGAWILLPTMGLVGAGVAWMLAQGAGSIACGLDLARKKLMPATASLPTLPAHIAPESTVDWQLVASAQPAHLVAAQLLWADSTWRVAHAWERWFGFDDLEPATPRLADASGNAGMVLLAPPPRLASKENMLTLPGIGVRLSASNLRAILIGAAHAAVICLLLVVLIAGSRKPLIRPVAVSHKPPTVKVSPWSAVPVWLTAPGSTGIVVPGPSGSRTLPQTQIVRPLSPARRPGR